MTQRRALLEGLGETLEVDHEQAEEFIYGKKPKSKPPAAEKEVAAEAPPVPLKEGKGPSSASRVGLTTRIRSDFAVALKRASLERQLNGIAPHTLQDILEEALQPWLRHHGYLN
jgi:hypothetical protein